MDLDDDRDAAGQASLTELPSVYWLDQTAHGTGDCLCGPCSRAALMPPTEKLRSFMLGFAVLTLAVAMTAVVLTLS
ncbi:hypothetical protein ACFV98_34910 [Streptomyces violascens]|uniref:hypothetical protein n=1 Tax=Streptomyces violascens TaxID=67381 RepID=UPI00365ED670